jgi:hypothetical protein
LRGSLKHFFNDRNVTPRLILFTGIFIVFLENILGANWFIVHVSFMMIQAAVLNISGFILMVLLLTLFVEPLYVHSLKVLGDYD